MKIHLPVSFLCLSSRYFRLFSQKYDFGIFRGSLENRGFTPLNSQVWNFQDFVIITNNIIRLLKKKVNNFIHFCGNGEKNGKSIFTFFTVVLEFPVRVSSSPCFYWEITMITPEEPILAPYGSIFENGSFPKQVLLIMPWTSYYIFWNRNIWLSLKNNHD